MLGSYGSQFTTLCCRRRPPLLDCVAIVSHICRFVKKFFPLSVSFLNRYTVQGLVCGFLVQSACAPVSAPLCPSSPRHIAFGGHGLARPDFAGGFLSCSPVSRCIRLCRCNRVQPGQMLGVWVLARPSSARPLYHSLSIKSSISLCFYLSLFCNPFVTFAQCCNSRECPIAGVVSGSDRGGLPPEPVCYSISHTAKNTHFSPHFHLF